MVDLPNIKNYPKETKRIYLIICIFAAFLNKRLANKMKKGLFYAILASILWAIVNPFIKQGLSYDFTPMNFAGIRFTPVGIILFAYTWHKGMWREICQHSKLFLNLILINMFMGYTAFYFGVDFVSGAISSIIMGMTPLINVLLAHLLASNDKLNTHKIISLIVSLIGLFLIIGMGSNGAPLDWKGITGIVLLLLSIIFQGYSAISVSEDKGKVNPIFLNACRCSSEVCLYIWWAWVRKVIILLSENPADFMPALRYWYSYLYSPSASGLSPYKAKAPKSATSICAV